MLPEIQRRGGCKACREGNLNCDKKRPRCGECVSSNKPCGGFDMGNIFINMNSTAPPVWNRSRNAQKYLVLDLASQPSGSGSFEPQFPSIPPLSQPLVSLSTSMTATTSTSVTDLEAQTTPASLDQYPSDISGMVELFLDLYYRRYAADKTSVEPLTAGNECGGWRYLLPYWIGKSSILDAAIHALATCFVGTQYQDQNLVDQANNMYLNALQMVQQVLPKPDSYQDKHLLATTLIMSSIELFMSHGGSASQFAHIDGATRLLHSASKAPDFEELHVYILTQGFLESITNRRRYVFSSASYRPVVQQMFACPRTSRNDLYFQWCEIVLPLPNILCAVDSASAAAITSHGASSTAASSLLAIVDDVTTLEQALSPWYDNLKKQTHGPWTVSATQTGRDMVPFPLQFVSIEVCTLYCLYWMTQMLVLEARSSLQVNSSLTELHSSEIPSPDLLAQAGEYASLICRSVQFCTSNTSYASTENMFIPLFNVASFYKRQGDDERMKWCIDAFARIAGEQKIGYSQEKLNLATGTVGYGAHEMGRVWGIA